MTSAKRYRKIVFVLNTRIKEWFTVIVMLLEVLFFMASVVLYFMAIHESNLDHYDKAAFLMAFAIFLRSNAAGKNS